jgi:hypothetical protein
VFDRAALGDVWRRVAGPVEVEHDLPELISQTERALQPPVFARDVLPALDGDSAQ